MCGITGFYSRIGDVSIERSVLEKMTSVIRHRGPDETSIFIDGKMGLGFQRLSIIDIAGGHQPFRDEERATTLICNGEIYNYKELRKSLMSKGYTFKTDCDVEVLLPLYSEYGIDFIKKLNGQFAFCLYDRRNDVVLLARDHFGICPLFFVVNDEFLVFGSEIKAIIEHPKVAREVELTGLDQVLSFPGVVSPHTLFKGVQSMKPGHYLALKSGKLSVGEYWDLDYPQANVAYEERPESYYINGVEERLIESVRLRLNADVPVGFYLSGGLDSSLIGSLMNAVSPNRKFPSFSICFPEKENRRIDERLYQRLVADHIGSKHNEIPFGWSEISEALRKAVYHSEAPLKETYNTCSLALSQLVSKNKVKVILSGEGADEIFGGYVGYRFDQFREINNSQKGNDDSALSELLEDEVRERLWGDSKFFYEKNQYEFKAVRQSLYSEEVNDLFHEFCCLENLEINKERLNNRDSFHKRSYLDLKLRLSDHLISDHCDRVTYANSVEGRYPFLDINLVEFARKIPSSLKLKGMTEKYILKQIAGKYLPEQIHKRQKFGFVAPGSPNLIRQDIEWVNDMLSFEKIKKDGYFNPVAVENLKTQYRRPDFELNLPFDNDLLIVVLTFNIFLDLFKMPSFK